MNGIELLLTAVLLGFYVALAGGYGLAYTFGRIQDAIMLRRLSFVLYGLHVLTAMAIVVWAPLGAGWKGLIFASSVAFLGIPPATWRLLQLTHETEVQG